MIGRSVAWFVGLALLSVGSFFAYQRVITDVQAFPTVSIADIRRIDAEAFRLVARARLSEADAFALYERLARLEEVYLERLALRDSKNLAGSIAPLAERVLCDAMPTECVYLWKTFEDHRATTNAVVRADTDTVIRADASPKEVSPTTVSPLVSLEDEQIAYDAMLQGRTTDKVRASLVWQAGDGTRRTSGVITDLVNGYVALDTNRDVVSFATLRAKILSDAYRAYRTGEALQGYVSPQGDETTAYPSALLALKTAAEGLLAHLHEQGARDLASELKEARNALWWSGAYYEYAITDAMTRTIISP